MKTKYLLMMIFATAVIVLSAGLPARASETDERIEAAAKNSYVFKTYLKDDNVTVRSQDGVVALTGTVADDHHRSLAHKTVESLPGVSSVDDKIQVKSPHPEENSDAWLALKVKATLLFHTNVSVTRTKVDVKDGMVTLQGEADNEAQKELTREYAEDVGGVKGVKNDIVVVKNPKAPDENMSEKIDDASITAQVKMALLYHRSTSVLSTRVETREGVVTVTGKVKNDAEKALVTKIVSDTRGVKGVVNNMEVQ